jgi:hypothetical protein
MTAMVLLALAGPAFAQNAPGDFPGHQPMSSTPTNINPGNTRTLWSPSLPAPAVDPGAPPAAFIQAALQALAAGRTGEAQEAIERAESRALDRSIRPSTVNQPSQQPLVQQLSQARQALGAGDRQAAATFLQAAARNPEASSP